MGLVGKYRAMGETKAIIHIEHTIHTHTTNVVGQITLYFKINHELKSSGQKMGAL